MTETKAKHTPGRYQVETYISGVPYKVKRFDTYDEAKAYQSDLFKIGHYYVPVIDRETADRKEWGTRLDLPLDECVAITRGFQSPAAIAKAEGEQ